MSRGSGNLKDRWQFRHPDTRDEEVRKLIDDIRAAALLRGDQLDAAYAIAGLSLDVQRSKPRNPAIRKRQKVEWNEVAAFVKMVLPEAEIISYFPPMHFAMLKHIDRFRFLEADADDTTPEPAWTDFQSEHKTCCQAALLLAALNGRQFWTVPGASNSAEGDF